MRSGSLLLAASLVFASASFAQNVGIGTSTPAARLDISSTNSGLLIPRVALTATSSASPLTSPSASTLVYNTATSGSGATAVTPGFYYWTGSAWDRMTDAASSGSTTISGDVTGTLAAATVAALQGKSISTTAPADAQVLIYNNSTGKWAPATVSGDVSMTDAGVVTLGTSSGNYIKNQTGQQATSNFNISGAGVIGTTLAVGTSTTSPIVQGATTASGTLTLLSTSSATKAAAGILMTDNITSSSTTTGTLVVTGGVGVSGYMNVGARTATQSFQGRCHSIPISGGNQTITLDRTDYFVLLTDNGSSSSTVTLQMPAPDAVDIGQVIIIRSAMDANYTLKLSSNSGSQLVAVGKSNNNNTATISYGSGTQNGTEYISDGTYWYQIY